ncbi:MAG TPA: MFS transporter [Streptosporangiaceae bacterium]|nr:MFS transporter [Streptosporangiaceae bacterium]
MNRWAVLAGYGLLAACSQLLWLSYAPITTQVHRVMGVSAGSVGDLAAIFPLMYVILALPCGRWLDVSFERALALGAILTGAGGLLRLVGPASFGWAIAGQFVIAAGQPLVLNSITKIAARYFPQSERTAAISIGSVSLYLGILAAALSAQPLFGAGGLSLLLRVQAGLAAVAAAWVLLALRTPAAFRGDPSVAVSLGWLKRDRFIWVLAGLLFVGMGIFNAVATWLDSILGHFGHGSASGYLIAILTVAGIAGAAIAPQAAANRDRRRAMLQITVGVTAVAFIAIAAVHGVIFIGIVMFIEGFVLLAALPVALDWSELHSGPERAGAAVGFLLLAGNLGGVVLVLIVQAVVGNPYLSLGALSVVALAGLALSTQLPARVGDSAQRKGQAG